MTLQDLLSETRFCLKRIKKKYEMRIGEIFAEKHSRDIWRWENEPKFKYPI